MPCRISRFGPLGKGWLMDNSSWFMIASIVAGAAFVFVVADLVGEGRGISYAKSRKACDVVVKRLMTTNDPTEIAA
jgi:hypothetical protein